MNAVKDALDAFLTHEKKRVLMFKGEWGVGKTWYWNYYLKNEFTKGETERKYAYVSLFGVENIVEAEQLILCKTVKIGGRYCRSKKLNSFSKKAFDWTKEIPAYKKWSGVLNRVARLFIKNYVVCLDDLERRSEKLSMDALLGFISQLKEENNCRIVLILNEDELSTTDRKRLSKFREKVVDQEVVYAPSLENNIKIIFGSRPNLNLLTNTFAKVGSKNIRLMQQVEWNLEPFRNLETAGIEPSLRESLIRHVVLLTAFYQLKTLDVDISMLNGTIQPMASIKVLGGDKEEEPTAEATASKNAAKFGYHWDELDKYIIKYLRDGKIDAEHFELDLKKRNDREKNSNVTQRINEIWADSHEKFSVSQSVLIQKIDSLLKNCIEHVPQKDFDELLRFRTELDPNTDSAKYWNPYVQGRLDAAGILELEQFKNRVSDPQILAEIDSRISVEMTGIDLPSCFSKFMDRKAYDKNYFAIMDHFSVSDFKDWILSDSREDFIAALEAFYDSVLFSTNDPQKQSLARKIKNALRQVAQTSDLNRIRVNQFSSNLNLEDENITPHAVNPEAAAGEDHE